MGETEAALKALQGMHASLEPTETEFLFQLGAQPGPLPADLKVRREQSQARQLLNAKAADPAYRMFGNEALVLGRLLYREGKDELALKALAQPISETSFQEPVAARAFATTANSNLGKKDEARRLLKSADERFNSTVIVPGEGMYQPWFPSSIMGGESGGTACRCPHRQGPHPAVPPIKTR